eukprot:TRINITY_DN42894_c0_g1_i1.p1 TRINITY_DN42894_c0_g1~~TRINITY_DN42894_c0_g1_i1.p1  ORF type:complete len:578 (+),score=148.92 TRINITY_DN42894_c0_g1_i1:61-1734(+)
MRPGGGSRPEVAARRGSGAQEANLCKCARAAFASDVIGPLVRRDGENVWRRLVLCDASAQGLAAAVDRTELTRHGFVLQELLRWRRKDSPLAICYLVEPTDSNVRILRAELAQASAGRQAAAAVFFACGSGDSRLAKAAGAVDAAAGAVVCLGSSPLACAPLEARVFAAPPLRLPREPAATIADPDFAAMYSGGRAALGAAATYHAERIAGALELLQWHRGPIAVRYAAGGAPGAEMLVSEVARSVAAAALRAPSAEPAETVVAIVDRGWDVVTPLLHGSTLQALVHDLLPVRMGCELALPASGGGGPDRVLLGEANLQWCAVRHGLLASSRSALQLELDNFVGRTKDRLREFERLAACSSAVKVLPFAEAHRLNMAAVLATAAAAVGAFNSHRLGPVVLQEQAQCAAAERGDAPVAACAPLASLLADEGAGVSGIDALRLVVSFIASFPASGPRLRSSLCEMTGQPRAAAAVERLAQLGVPVGRGGRRASRGDQAAQDLVDPELFGRGGRLETLPQKTWQHRSGISRALSAARSGGFDDTLWASTKEPGRQRCSST